MLKQLKDVTREEIQAICNRQEKSSIGNLPKCKRCPLCLICQNGYYVCKARSDYFKEHPMESIVIEG